MKKNYLIGIGGTGARVIESVVYLCAAGLGPKELNLFLIDPDSGNGNLARTRAVLDQYKKCRDKVKGNNKNLFSTEIKFPSDPVWGVFEGEDTKRPETTKLNSIIKYSKMQDASKNLAGLVDLLFTQEELDTQLTEGFRGHPSIGSVVMSQKSKSPAWQMLFDDLDATNVANDIGVFLVGSIFGGTGAAGVPTFGAPKIIKHHEKAKMGDDKSKIVLGGAIVLPYFTFDHGSDDKQKTEKVFIKPEDFSLATKAALEFYSEKELAFDSLYLIGDSLSQKVGGFAPGKDAQKNDPHYIEIATTLSAFDFFRHDFPTSESIPKRYYISARKDDAITWESFPANSDGNDNVGLQQFKRKLISLTVFSYSLSTYGWFVLKNENDPEAKNATWFRDLFKEKKTEKDPRITNNEEDIKLIKEFSEQYLMWFSKISSLDKVELLNTDNLFESEGVLYDYHKYPDKIGNLIKEKTENLTMSKYIGTFMTENIKKLENVAQKTAVEKFIEIFLVASEQFTAANYPVTQKKE